MTLEVCCGDLESVLAAKAGGAQRIELCSALSEGGLTPSLGLIEQAIGSGIKAVNVLIRPRKGDFLYTEGEIAEMESDIRHAVKAGAAGVVIGALTPDGDVDVAACRRMIAAARSCAGRADVSVTFHRAFDLCRDPEKSLEEIISLGCDRILTSGLAPSALEGLNTLRRLNTLAAGRIIILAGGGVTSANVRQILSGAGLTELHASAKKSVGSGMRFRRNDVSMAAPGNDEYSRKVTDSAEVAEMVALMQNP